MVADLSAQLDTLVNHDVVAALAVTPGTQGRPRHRPGLPCDARPAREHLVLTPTPTQQVVIDAVRWGANLVIKVAGTGKSQTIANLIVWPGQPVAKRTLFVAENVLRSMRDRAARAPRPGRPVLDVYDGPTNRGRLAQSSVRLWTERGTPRTRTPQTSNAR